MSTRAIALALVLAGCSRSFSAAGGGQLSAPCDADGECASGFCADGVCCSARCGATESCDAPGAVGRCSPRPLGTACDAGASCPNGNCVDLVCCDSTCGGNCSSCALPGQVGVCTDVADGTDPRGSCGYACTACYGGTCSPAPLDTNPENRCDAGLACSLDQTCRVPTGATCAAKTDCTGGACLVKACASELREDVSIPQFNASATFRYPLASAVRADGSASVLLSEVEFQSGDQKDFNGDCPNSIGIGVSQGYAEDRVLLLERSVSGAWTGSALFDSNEDDCGMVPASLTYEGSTLFAALYNETFACTSTEVPCGVFMVQRSEAGEDLEVVDPDVKNTSALSLKASDDGRLGLAYDGQLVSGARHLFVRTRTPPDGWSPAQDIGPIDASSSTLIPPFMPRSAFALSWLGGEEVVIYSTVDGGLAAWTSAGGVSVPVPDHSADVGLSCEGGLFGPIFSAVEPDGVVASALCGNQEAAYIFEVDSTGHELLAGGSGSYEDADGNDLLPLVSAPVDAPDGFGVLLVQNNAYGTGDSSINGSFIVGYGNGQQQTDTVIPEVEDNDSLLLDGATVASDPSGEIFLGYSTSNYDFDSDSITAGPFEIWLLRR